MCVESDVETVCYGLSMSLHSLCWVLSAMGKSAGRWGYRQGPCGVVACLWSITYEEVVVVNAVIIVQCGSCGVNDIQYCTMVLWY